MSASTTFFYDSLSGFLPYNLYHLTTSGGVISGDQSANGWTPSYNPNVDLPLEKLVKAFWLGKSMSITVAITSNISLDSSFTGSITTTGNDFVYNATTVQTTITGTINFGSKYLSNETGLGQDFLPYTRSVASYQFYKNIDTFHSFLASVPFNFAGVNNISGSFNLNTTVNTPDGVVTNNWSLGYNPVVDGTLQGWLSPCGRSNFIYPYVSTPGSRQTDKIYFLKDPMDTSGKYWSFNLFSIPVVVFVDNSVFSRAYTTLNVSSPYSTGTTETNYKKSLNNSVYSKVTTEGISSSETNTWTDLTYGSGWLYYYDPAPNITINSITGSILTEVTDFYT